MSESLLAKTYLATTVVLFVAVLIFTPIATHALQATSPIRKATTSTLGTEANGTSSDAMVSADGRYVAFQSTATNLVPDDTNAASDAFVKDIFNGVIQRVSTDSSGAQSNGSCVNVAISADGRFVVCRAVAAADNLVPDDTNGVEDIIVKNLVTGEAHRVSTDASGNQADGGSFNPAISADGRYVSFQSGATNLVPDDTNGTTDIFVKDMISGAIERVSTDSSGNQSLTGGSTTGMRSLSADGRFVAFYSASTTMVPDDTNGVTDIFVKDRQTNTTARVTTNSAGVQQNNSTPTSYAISARGRYVTFRSNATNLVPNDTNGVVDQFRKDLDTNETVRISTDKDGQQGTGGSAASVLPGISDDGRFIIFLSPMNNLVPDDTNGIADHFVKDVVTGVVARVSTDAGGIQANDGDGSSSATHITGDGRYVTFRSDATNLVPNDTNGIGDIFHRANPLATFAEDDDFTDMPLDPSNTTRSVLANDIINGSPVTPTDYIVSLTDVGELAGTTINGQGVLTLPSDMLSGTHILTYRLCEVVAPDYCTSATVSVLGASASLSETGLRSSFTVVTAAFTLVILGTRLIKRNKKYTYRT